MVVCGHQQQQHRYRSCLLTGKATKTDITSCLSLTKRFCDTRESPLPWDASEGVLLASLRYFPVDTFLASLRTNASKSRDRRWSLWGGRRQRTYDECLSPHLRRAATPETRFYVMNGKGRPPAGRPTRQSSFHLSHLVLLLKAGRSGETKTKRSRKHFFQTSVQFRAPRPQQDDRKIERERERSRGQNNLATIIPNQDESIGADRLVGWLVLGRPSNPLASVRH